MGMTMTTPECFAVGGGESCSSLFRKMLSVKLLRVFVPFLESRSVKKSI